MKNGKIILGAAAFLVTAATTLAFKTHAKFSNRHHLYGKNGSGTCKLATCRTTISGHGTGAQCKSAIGATILATSGNNSMYLTSACGTSTYKTWSQAV